MRGIRRESGRSPEQAPPLLTEHIKNIVEALPGSGEPPEGTEAEAAWLRGKRDRALILMGFAGAFRRSELAALRMEHIDSRPDGLLVTVPAAQVLTIPGSGLAQKSSWAIPPVLLGMHRPLVWKIKHRLGMSVLSFSGCSQIRVRLLLSNRSPA